MSNGEKNNGEVELLSFRLGEQEYCLDIMSVREIRGWTSATPLPHAPRHVKGVINLRGIVLPVVDLSVRLGMDPVDSSEHNVIIVVQDEGRTCGLLVSAVSDILTIDASDHQPLPELARDPNMNFLRALTLVDDRLIRILDLASVLPSDHMEAA